MIPDFLSIKKYELPVSFTQAQVIEYANLVNDHNPLHLDAEYAATTSFKKPVVHGMLTIAVFSKFFGTIWPAEGTLYLKQETSFKRPVYPEVEYVAVFTLLEHFDTKHEALIKTDIINKVDGKICVTGIASIKHPILL